MADVKYSVEVAYFTKGRVHNPMAHGQRDYDRAQAKSFREALAHQRRLEAEEKRRIRTMASANRRRNNYLVDGGSGVIQHGTKAFAGLADSLTSALTSGIVAGVTAAGGLLAAGFGATIKTGISFADEMERAEISMAAMQHMHLGVSFEEGMRVSGRVMEQARKDAAALPGEMSDIVGIMKTIAAPGLQNGMNMDRLETMSARAVAMAEVEGMSGKVAGSQLAMMLEGRMTSRQSFGRRMGFQAKELNAMKPEARIHAIEAALEKADPAIEAYKQSWKGLTSSVVDNFKQIARTVSTPLFERMKQVMRNSLKFLTDNGPQIDAFTSKLGKGIATAFEYGHYMFNRWGPLVRTFGKNLGHAMKGAFDHIKPILDKLGPVAERFLANPNSPSHVAAAVGGIAALKVASIGAMGLGGMAGMAAPFLKAGMVGGTGAVGAAEAAAVGGGGAAVAAGGLGVGGALGIAAVALAAIIIPLSGAFLALTDTAWFFHDTAMGFSEDIWTNLKSMGESALRIWKVVGPFVVGSLETVGTMFLGLVSNVLYVGSKVVSGIATVFEAIWAEILRMGKMVGIDLSAAAYKAAPDALRRTHDDLLRPERDDDGKGTNKSKTIPNNTTHIHNVEIKVNSNQDPFRVARATVKALNEISRNPKLSRGSAGSEVAR